MKLLNWEVSTHFNPEGKESEPLSMVSKWITVGLKALVVASFQLRFQSSCSTSEANQALL
jgi:hypothetical protein